jgi:hypothetical protein
MDNIVEITCEVDNNIKKIAFCFLIYDCINHEELWNKFFVNADKNKYTIYIHYKYDKQLKYFESHKLKNCIATKYEDQTIPLAYNILFREAYKDENNYKFVILSGACIPFKSFNYIYNKLTSNHYGYFNICPQSQCFPNCNYLLTIMDKKYISKSHNWFILNRKLVENLCFEDKDEILNKHYNNIYAPAEYFYYTFIKLLDLENEILITNNESNSATTFTNWKGMDYKYVTDRSLKTYETIEEEELNYLLESACLFGRKFSRDCIISLCKKEYIEKISK